MRDIIESIQETVETARDALLRSARLVEDAQHCRLVSEDVRAIVHEHRVRRQQAGVAASTQTWPSG
jgi:hypothetical protein